MLSADTASAAVTAGALWTDAPASAAVTGNASASLAGGTVAAVNVSGAPAGGVTFLSLGFAVVLDVNATRAATLVASLAADFPSAWARAGDSWEALWAAAFTPNNTVFAGHLPVVEVRGSVEDALCCARRSVDPNAARVVAPTPAQALAPSAAPVSAVYYASVVSLLQLLRWGPAAGALQVSTRKQKREKAKERERERENFGGAHHATAPLPPQPAFPRWVVPTAGPEWAVTDEYVWDTSMVATALSLLDPPAFLSQVR